MQSTCVLFGQWCRTWQACLSFVPLGPPYISITVCPCKTAHYKNVRFCSLNYFSLILFILGKLEIFFFLECRTCILSTVCTSHQACQTNFYGGPFWSYVFPCRGREWQWNYQKMWSSHRTITRTQQILASIMQVDKTIFDHGQQKNDMMGQMTPPRLEFDTRAFDRLYVYHLWM